MQGKRQNSSVYTKPLLPRISINIMAKVSNLIQLKGSNAVVNLGRGSKKKKL